MGATRGNSIARNANLPCATLFGKNDMRLADFSVSESGAILAQWEEFRSRALPAAASMSRGQLRDQAAQLLSTIALDLGTYQSENDQGQKSRRLAFCSRRKNKAFAFGYERQEVTFPNASSMAS